ncbi:hypothetical protein MTO96_046841 [Rhipicephalus appendiculatus]
MSWSKSLAVIPETLTEEKVEAYSASRKLAKRNNERSHKFAAESYVQTASIETSSCTDSISRALGSARGRKGEGAWQCSYPPPPPLVRTTHTKLLRKLQSSHVFLSDSTLIRVRALCYRSQKKTAPAYKVSAAFSHDGNIHDCTCECAARENGACHHILGLLKVVLLLKKNGYNEAPPELSCTELPQQWRRPRGDRISACGVDELDWRAPRPGGLEHIGPVNSRCSSPGKEQPAAEQEYRWKKARKYRLTASNFGTVVAREKWTPKGLQNLTSDKDLSRVRAVQ